MFDTKLEVDRHVESCLKKINNEVERNLKCIAFARLYFKVGEYEQARRHISAYLTAKPLSAEALCLLGKSLEKQSKREEAIDAYRKSLDIDPKQNNLVLRVCELLTSDDVGLDVPGAQYFCEKAQSFDPHNPIVFNLKERLVAAESHDPGDVTQLLLTELASRPTDVHLRVRLLRHLLQNNHVKEAYKHAFDIEQKNLPIFLNNLSWYETISEVLVRYQRDNMATLTWEFWMLLISVLEKQVALNLDERSSSLKRGTDCVSVVFNLDQTLENACKNITASCNERSLVQEFLNHYRAQLCFHLMTLLFKQAKRDLIKYKEAMQMALPLLFAAYHTQPAELHALWLDHSSDTRRQQVQRWHREAAYRCSQAGHILLATAKDRKVAVIEKATQGCSGLWREQLFKKLFVTRDQQVKLKTSYFVTCPSLIDITVRLPDMNELVKYDEVAQMVYPDSLHHLVWIGLNQKLATFKCVVYEGLQYSVKQLNNCSAESLSILDIDAFLYCTTLSVQQQLQEMKHQVYYNMDKPNVLPAAVTSQLGTLNQCKWLMAAYKMYKNEYGSDMSELRLSLIRGIEVVRCVGNHGLDVKLLVVLANAFTERARNLTKQSEMEYNEARAELYWKAALPLLEKLQKNQAITYASNRLFEYKSKEMSPSEIVTHIDEGKLFSATQLMKKKEYEKALRTFESLMSPYASFHQAQIYKLMADEQMNQNKENVTSEMRSQYIILLSRARDCFYLTLDRLRNPSVDRKHPLNAQLGTEIEKIERLLSRIDPDLYNHRNECDGMSDDNVSSAGSMGDLNNMYSSTMGNSFYPNESVTPQYDRNVHSARYRFELPVRREARPSPERLDAQLRQMQASRDTAISHILEQNRIMVESHRNLVDELRTFRDAVNNLTTTVDDLKTVKQSVNNELREIKESVNGLKNAVDELQNFRDVTDVVQEMKKEIAEMKKDSSKPKATNQLSEEDLYVLDEEYGGDYGIAAGVSGFNTNALYHNYQARLASANALTYPPPALYPGMYPMYPFSNMPLPQAGAIPYGQDAQIPDFRALTALSQGLSQYAQTNIAQPPGLPQQKTPWDLLNPVIPQLGLVQPGLTVPPPTQPPTIPQPQQLGIFKDTKLDPSIIQAPNTIFSTAPITSSPNLPVNRSGPVNVVITTSDPLPKMSVQTTQVLSVTIPPQHLKKTQPHNYQIPLPTTTISSFSTTPTIINQPPLVVSTEGLLSNISPPIYSAIESTKSPSRSIGLGLQIERSLSSANNSATIDEHDPCPDFKPIIPLPDEVPLNTGEENEIVLFCQRAKLFRFTNKEWRERGIGNIKILHNKDNGKVRILMRRDQVHKICANHFMTADMVLTPMPNNPRAYIWAAYDFADEQSVLEKLCVRFKSEEEAHAFNVAFENAKKILSELTDEIENKPESPVKTETTSLGGFIFTSTPTFKTKDLISTPKPSIPIETTKTSPFAGFTFGTKTTFSSPALEIKPVASPKTPTDDFEPTVEFTPVIPLPELVDVKTGEENAEILFESRAKLLRYDTVTKEWKERGVGIMKILKENTIRLLMRREQVHRICCNHQLLKSMQFSKMPNNTKALTWYAKDFSEGVVVSEMFAIRFKAEEQAGAFYKAIINSQQLLDENNVVKSDEKVVIPEIKSSGKSVKMKAKEDKKVKSEPKVEVPKLGFGDKFKAKLGSWECKNCYIVNEGKDQSCVACDSTRTNSSPKKSSDVDQSQFSFSATSPPITTGSLNVQLPFGQSTEFMFGQKPAVASTASWGDAFKPKVGSWECSMCLVRNDGDKLYCVSCETPKDDSVPKKDFKTKGVNLDTPGLQFTFGVDTSKQATDTKTTAPSWGDAFKPKEGSWGCKHCLIRNDSDKLKCVACNIAKDESLPEQQPLSKGINLDTPGLQFKFGVSSASVSDTTAASSIFSFTQPPSAKFTFGSTNLTGDGGSSTKPFQFIPATKNEQKETDEDRDQFVFGSPQKHSFEFTPRSPRTRHGSSGQGDEESDSYVEEEEDNIHFKPVIPLPDKVEVKTGEEQEDVLYCHRAKLFRFVQGEWKERGIGDIKILSKPDTGKLRILMRRDQVLKICLNHILTADIEYLPKDEKTWLFSAPDFSEGEINHWQFCVRFKTAEIAQDFKNAVDKAVSTSLQDGGATAINTVEDNSDVEFISETQVTTEEEAEALKLKLPPKFMAYRQLPDCNCATCKEDDLILAELFKKDIQQPSIFGSICKPFSSGESPGKFLFGTPFKAASFGISNAPTPTATTTTPAKTESLKDILLKPSLLGSVSRNESLSSALPKTTTASDALKNFSFRITTDAAPPINLFGGPINLITKTETTTNLPTQTTPSPFGGGATVGSTFAGTTTPTGSLFDTSKTNETTSSFGGFTPQKTSMVFGSGSILGNFSASPSSKLLGSTSTNSLPASTNIFAQTPVSTAKTTVSESKLFGGDTSTFGMISSNAPPSFSSLAANVDAPNKEQDDLVFESDSNLSFAKLAADSTSAPVFVSQPSDNAKPFSFLGSGAPVFHSLAAKGKKEKSKDESKGENEESDTEDAEEHDPQFEPIVPLPDAIVVSTGEEEEVLLFNERAKLYRFDNDNKEWKERGIGQMKILHHPVNGTYRFLLRREQVHKVVLNMLITSNVDLQPMTTSDKAWLWCGYNYTEDTTTLEKLAVRFKNTELAAQFHNAVQQVLVSLATQQQNQSFPLMVENYELISSNSEHETSHEISHEGLAVEDVADEHEEDDDDEDDDDVEDERSMMFVKPCVVSEELPTGWQPIGHAELQLYYDPDIYGSRIAIIAEDGNVLSNTLIGVNTEMTVDEEENSCVWRAVEWTERNSRWRTLKVTFDEPQSALIMHSNYLESVQYARESDLVDDLLRHTPDFDYD